MAECSVSVVSNDINTNKQINTVENSEERRENKTDNAMEPIFVDDYQNEELPKTIQNLLKFLEESEVHPTRNDILAGLIYIITLETGFVPSDYEEHTMRGFELNKHLEYASKLPRDWKQSSCYQFTFYEPGYKQHLCKIVCCPLIDDLVVNCYVQDIEGAKYTIYLDTLAYFSCSSVTIHNLRLQNLRGLSYKVKDAICYPARQAVLKLYSQLNKCIEALPDEIIVSIVDMLETKYFVRFGGTCKRFNAIMKAPFMWNRRLKRDLGIYLPNGKNMRWSLIYDLYQMRKPCPTNIITYPVFWKRLF